MSKIKTRNIKWYGWKPSIPDHRDLKFERKISPKDVLPMIDLRPDCPMVVDQGPAGSCVGNGVAGAFQYEEMRQGRKIYVPDGAKHHDPSLYAFAPSRLFIYLQARKMEGTADSDSGAEIRDAIKAIATLGVCSSKSWPYHIRNLTVDPPPECYVEARTRGVALAYRSIKNTSLEDMLACLSERTPIIFGFTVFDSFESDAVAQSGYVPMPKKSESILGGHCVVAVGYDTHKRIFIVRNSWGNDWGDKGYCYMPFKYLTDPNLSDDFWAISKVD